MIDWLTTEGMIKFIWILIAFIIFFNMTSWWSWWQTNYSQNTEEENAKMYRIKELQDLIQRKELQIENMILKHEEIYQEIKDLEIESSMDFEKEEKNNLKIKKLDLKLKHIEMNTANMVEEKFILEDELKQLLW